MDIFIDRSPLETVPGFVDEDLRLCLESAMHVALDESVKRGWYTQPEADAELSLWRSQFSD